MTIKKEVIAGVLYAALLISGWFLMITLFENLSRTGLIGYLMLWVFILSLFWVIKYHLSIKNDDKLAKRVAEEVVKEYEEQFKNMPEVITQEIKLRELHKEGYTSTEHWKAELNKHLLNKSAEIKIVINRKSIQSFFGEVTVITIIYWVLAFFFSQN